jgi:transposase InsO family protein
MSNRPPLTLAEKERIYLGKLQGHTLSELALEIGCTLHCARKWWRIGRAKGLEGLRGPRRGRGQRGTLSQFDAGVVERALTHKRTHPGWGANRVLIELKQDPDLSDVRLPGCSRLAVLFKERCPECVAPRKPRGEPTKRPPVSTAVHEMWQLDSQEGIRLHSGEIATVCNVRDPVGAAMIASRAFSVKTKRRWRKLDWTEVREVLRSAFTEWQTMPDSVLTDNELGLAGGPNDPFPGRLTLWLAGLGIRHRFIRPGQPTDQPHVERSHRTLDGLALDDRALTDCLCLQQSVDRERDVYNQLFPSQASDCAGRPPLIAHPELRQPRRHYRPDQELIHFDLQRVYDYLSTFTFTRTVNSSAQVSLGRQMYSLGKKLVREQKLRTVLVRFDPEQATWVFRTQDGDELVRRPLKGLDVYELTGLEPDPIQLAVPVQLALPFLVA